MNPTEPHDPIDALLHSQDLYVEDAGFTERVLAALPRRRHDFLRPVLLLGATAIGSVLAARWLPWHDLASLDFSALPSPNAASLVLAISVAASLAWGIISAVAEEE